LKQVFLVSSTEMAESNLDTENSYLIDALEKLGIKASIQHWNLPEVRWSEANLVISRNTSTYIWYPDRFLTWARKVEETTPLWNSSQAMDWSHHKRYLIELQKNGVPVPETILIAQNTEKSMEEILNSVPWDEFVLKPSIGAGSCGLKRFTRNSPNLETHFRNLNKNGFTHKFPFGEFEYIPCDTLIQPFIPEITKKGELSLIFFGGKYSHCVSKMVKPGDFRAHPIWGAKVELYDPSDREIQVAADSLKVVGFPTEYARIDMVPLEPVPMVMEVELIDPYLFFEHVPETAQAYASHIKHFLKS
jgi:glutathione synthase/RimK-type ligase-like ATP-grasp enzyme